MPASCFLYTYLLTILFVRVLHFNCVFICSTLHVNYYLYHFANKNILFNAIVTRMNKYIIMIFIAYICHVTANVNNTHLQIIEIISTIS